MHHGAAPPTPVSKALAQCRSGLIYAVVISCIMNVLMFTGPFYMLQIYDRVLPAHSLPTLVGVSLLALFLLAVYGVLDLLRSRLMTRIGALLDLSLADMSFTHQAAPRWRAEQAGKDALRDLGVVRQFVGSPASTGLMDVPWLPLFVVMLYVLHPMMGHVAAISVVVFLAIATLNELRSRPLAQNVEILGQQEQVAAFNVRSNIDTVRAMGMFGTLQQSWAATHTALLKAALAASDRSASYGTFTKTLRLILQSAILGLGAYLVIKTELSSGALIACSIIFARALQPIDQAVGQWRLILAARRSWSRLCTLSDVAPQAEPMPLRLPSKALAIKGLTVSTPDGKRELVETMTFNLVAGDGLGVIGPSGSGKTSLLRGIVGALPTTAGEIRLDGATPDQWLEANLGTSVGYMAQDVQLLDGTLAHNISRFARKANPDDIVEAAVLAGVHDLILSLPDGYDTMVGLNGHQLSAGQKQRIGLARAAYRMPFLVVLDEPNAHLDNIGEQALCRAVRRLRANGSIVIVAAHRNLVLNEVTKLLLIEKGHAKDFGDRAEVLARISGPPRPQNIVRGIHVVGS